MSDEQLLLGFLAPYSGRTRRAYLRTMLEWIGVLLQSRLGLLVATRQHIEAWSAAEQRRGLSKASVGSKLVVVCGFYRWAYQEGYLDHDPGVYVRRPSRPRRSSLRWLEAGQLARLLDAARDVDDTAHVLACLLALNGLRLGEVLAARVEHLGRQGELVTLLLPSRKGGVMDRVSLPGRTVQAMTPLIAGRTRGLILRSAAGRPLTQASVYRLLDQLAAAAEVEPVRPHMLRATFVTLALDAGVPIRDVMASTGHAHAAMVDYYDRGHRSIRRNASHRVAAHVESG